MPDQQEIEQSIREEFPILFLGRDTLDAGQYLQKRGELIEYSIAVSQPFLSPETIRYQAMLLYASLIFLSFSLLQIGKIKIGDELVTVDKKLLLFYEIFIGLITVIFLTKVYIDFRRAEFARAKNDHIWFQFQEFLAMAHVRKLIQNYFWLEVCNTIGPFYKAYDDAQAKALGTTAYFKDTSFNVLSLNLNELRKNSELEPSISAHERFLSALKTQILKDESRFNDKADSVFRLAARAQHGDFFDCFSGIQTAFKQTLEPWFEARSTLSREGLEGALEMEDSKDVARLKAQAALLGKIAGLRRMYTLVEIVAPMLFALLAILYVQFRSTLGQTGIPFAD